MARCSTNDQPEHLLRYSRPYRADLQPPPNSRWATAPPSCGPSLSAAASAGGRHSKSLKCHPLSSVQTGKGESPERQLISVIFPSAAPPHASYTSSIARCIGEPRLIPSTRTPPSSFSTSLVPDAQPAKESASVKPTKAKRELLDIVIAAPYECLKYHLDQESNRRWHRTMKRPNQGYFPAPTWGPFASAPKEYLTVFPFSTDTFGVFQSGISTT